MAASRGGNAHAQAHFYKSCKSVNFFFRGRGGVDIDLVSFFLVFKTRQKFQKSLDKMSRESVSIYFDHKILPFDRYAAAVTSQ